MCSVFARRTFLWGLLWVMLFVRDTVPHRVDTCNSPVWERRARLAATRAHRRLFPKEGR